MSGVIKLTRSTPDATPGTLLVEGDLAGEAIAELEAACRPQPAGVLDLRGVRSASGAGCETLIRLRRAGWQLVGASLYLGSLLQESDA